MTGSTDAAAAEIARLNKVIADRDAAPSETQVRAATEAAAAEIERAGLEYLPPKILLRVIRAALDAAARCTERTG